MSILWNFVYEHKYIKDVNAWEKRANLQELQVVLKITGAGRQFYLDKHAPETAARDQTKDFDSKRN